MASFIVVSDAPPEEWQSFVTETMQAASGKKVRGVAVVYLLAEPDEDGATVLTGYFNTSVEDKAYAAAHIQADVVDGIARANIRDWMDRMERDREEGEEE